MLSTSTEEPLSSSKRQTPATFIRSSPVTTRSRASAEAAEKVVVVVDVDSRATTAPPAATRGHVSSNSSNMASSAAPVPSQVEAARACLKEISISHKHPQQSAVNLDALKEQDTTTVSIISDSTSAAFKGTSTGYSPQLLVFGHIQKTLEDKYNRVSKQIKKEVFSCIEQIGKLQSQKAKIESPSKPAQHTKRSNQLSSSILAPEALVDAQRDLDRAMLQVEASRRATLVSIKDSEIKFFQQKLVELLESLPGLAVAIVGALHLPKEIAEVHTADLTTMLVRDFQNEKQKQIARQEQKVANSKARAENSQRAAAAVLESSEKAIQTVIQKTLHSQLSGFFKKAHNVLSRQSLRPEDQSATLEKIAADLDSKLIKGSVASVDSFNGKRPATPDTDVKEGTEISSFRKLRNTSKSPKPPKNGNRRLWRRNSKSATSSATSASSQKSNSRNLREPISRSSSKKKVAFRSDFTKKERKKQHPERTKQRSKSSSRESSQARSSSRGSSNEISRRSSSNSSRKQQQQPRATAAATSGRGRRRGRRQR